VLEALGDASTGAYWSTYLLTLDFFRKLPILLAMPGLSLILWLLAEEGVAGSLGSGLSLIVWKLFLLLLRRRGVGDCGVCASSVFVFTSLRGVDESTDRSGGGGEGRVVVRVGSD
jgi:hypothetical protein